MIELSNDVLNMVAGMLTAQITEHNGLVAEVGALTSDRTKLVHDYLTDEDTDDETIKAWQEWDAMAAAEREAQATAIREYVAKTKLPEIDEDAVKAKSEKIVELNASIKAARKFAETVPGYSEEALGEIPAQTHLKGKSSGNGGKRPRFDRVSYRLTDSDPWTEVKSVKDSKDGTKVEVTNLSLLATTLKSVLDTKVEVKALQEAAFAEAGTDDLSTIGGTVFDFVIAVGDNNVQVQVQPKAATA